MVAGLLLLIIYGPSVDHEEFISADNFFFSEFASNKSFFLRVSGLQRILEGQGEGAYYHFCNLSTGVYIYTEELHKES